MAESSAGYIIEKGAAGGKRALHGRSLHYIHYHAILLLEIRKLILRNRVPATDALPPDSTHKTLRPGWARAVQDYALYCPVSGINPRNLALGIFSRLLLHQVSETG